MVTSHTDQYTKRLSCINLHDHTHQPKPNHLGFGVMSMENATQDWLHHTTINTRKAYHVSTFMIKRIKHNPTILALELSTWKELRKIVASHTGQYTKIYHASNFMIIRIKHNPTILALELSTWKELYKFFISYTYQYTKILSCINLHDHTHQPKPNHLGVGVINMERATQDSYITHRSIHKKIIMHQTSWSYESSITQPSWRWSYQHGKSYTRCLHHTPINIRKYYHASTFMIIRINQNPTILALELWAWKMLHKIGYITQRSIHEKLIMYQPSWSNASSITQPTWLWRFGHGKSYTRCLHHTPVNARKDYHVTTFMIKRIKHNPTILALQLSTWKELRKIVTSHTGQYTKILSCIKLHDHTHQA